MMKNVKLEIGKYYLLDSTFPYWCVNIQRKVIFEYPLIVKFTHSIWNEEGGFGEIVEVGKGGFGKDLQTDTEIEFGPEHVMNEYQFNDKEIIYFTDFLPPNKNNNFVVEK